ncbi:MFS transporter [Sphingobium sp. AN558]|uniref:MFS transporter n=1 Tax=Sphingobium sp. AN558 TaxID=3133442 RepID=UPI0030BB06F4
MAEMIGFTVAARQPRLLRSNTRRLAILLFLAYSSLITIFQGVQNILLPPVVQRLAPDAKVSTMALLVTLASVTTVISLFVGGSVSDRTQSRWGRRAPSLALSWFAAMILMPVMGIAGSVALLAVAMPLLWFALNYYQSVLLAALPDRIPEDELGFASAAIGLGAPVGIFCGVNLAAFASNTLVGYILLAIPFTILTWTLLLLEPEGSSADMSVLPRQPLSLTSFLAQFSSVRERNFALALASRFLMFLCYFAVNGYMFYIVQDYVGAARVPFGNVAAGVSILLSVMTVTWLVVTIGSGYFADRIARTALVVAFASFAAAIVTLLPAASARWPIMLAFALGIGLTFGAYFVLDLKLATLVLPTPETAGRDLGILLAAGSAPGVISPAIAASIIEAGGYPALFVFGAAVAALAGVCAILIRIAR